MSKHEPLTPVKITRDGWIQYKNDQWSALFPNGHARIALVRPTDGSNPFHHYEIRIVGEPIRFGASRDGLRSAKSEIAALMEPLALA